MSSTVYLVESGEFFGDHAEPFIATSLHTKMSLRFTLADLKAISRNRKMLAKNNDDKLWAALENIFESQK